MRARARPYLAGIGGISDIDTDSDATFESLSESRLIATEWPQKHLSLHLNSPLSGIEVFIISPTSLRIFG